MRNTDGVLGSKAALVTGAASGIGRAIAVAFAEAGAAVLVSDLDADGAERVADELRRGGADASALAADVADPAAQQDLVARAVAHFGRLDIACNNAGIGGALAPTAEHPRDAWDRVIAVNLGGVFHGMQAQIPELLKTGGAIVNIASVLGQVGFANAPAYVAVKHGVVGLTRTAALEYAARGLRINAIGPAFIETPMIAPVSADAAQHAALVALHPIGRLGRAEEVAAAAVWLASPAASFVCGAYLAVDGGYLAR